MGWTYHWGRAWEEMGNNGFGENFEGRHTFANSKQEVRTPLSKLIWGTMNIKAHMHICMHMHVHVHVLVCEKKYTHGYIKCSLALEEEDLLQMILQL